jgi:hypothetical protein
MTCPECASVVEREDIPHVARKCAGCGREIHVVERGEHGKGIVIRPGDRFIIPPGALRLSLNPLESSGRLFRPGLDMLVRNLFLADITLKEDTFEEDAFKLEQYTDQVLNAFPPLSGLDINNPQHAEKIIAVMQNYDGTREFWALWVGYCLAVSREARAQGDTKKAVWAMACAERFRSMMLFKESLEDVVWMGQSVKRLLDVLAIWDANRLTSDEEFWQTTFTEHSYVLSQVFAFPVVFIKDKAYVGGMKLDRSEARFVDYLFSAESSREAILVEIKAPTTPLLGTEYRGNAAPSRDLSGAVVQVLNYRRELVANLKSVTEGIALTAFLPKCVLVMGNAASQLRDEASRRSFELFRGGLRDVEVITYDELFRKVEVLAELFSLKRKASSSDAHK